ncbi:hypothetical protein Hanom_Chr05g00448531 [Helianthus anomalus]
MTLYVAFIREGNFRLPMTKFTGLPRITHFEFICRANRIEQTFEMFNVFYFGSYTGGFYSFNSRTGGVNPCSTNPPKSLHDWKQNFFYIHHFAEQEWYKVLAQKVTSIAQLEERSLVATEMNMLWAPQNPRCPYLWLPKKKYYSGYSLMNVLDPKADGAVVVATLFEGRPLWLDQIRDRFLHPSSESLVTYANAILGEDGGDDLDDVLSPTREEVIVLSSEGSDRSHEGLIARSPRAGPPQGTVNEPVNEPAGDDVDAPTNIAEQLETRKKKKVDKSEKKKVEEPVTRSPRCCCTCSEEIQTSERGYSSPSESEVDLGVLSAKPGNLLEKIYAASGSRGTKFSGGSTGAGGDDNRGGGVDAEVESSEATLRHTTYTKRVRSSGEGGASGTHHSPEYEHVQGGSWDTHNPTCADLP